VHYVPCKQALSVKRISDSVYEMAKENRYHSAEYLCNGWLGIVWRQGIPKQS
jgi:predicted ATPase